jgi:hypothetical protein
MWFSNPLKNLKNLKKRYIQNKCIFLSHYWYICLKLFQRICYQRNSAFIDTQIKFLKQNIFLL